MIGYLIKNEQRVFLGIFHKDRTAEHLKETAERVMFDMKAKNPTFYLDAFVEENNSFT